MKDIITAVLWVAALGTTLYPITNAATGNQRLLGLLGLVFLVCITFAVGIRFGVAVPALS